MIEPAAGVDEEEPDRRQHGGEPHAEGNDQEKAEGDAAEGDRSEHHDEGRRAREEPARDAEREETAPGESPLPRIGGHV